MSEEILINVTSQEVRAAVIEGGVVQQVFIERRARRGLTGNIYQGESGRYSPFQREKRMQAPGMVDPRSLVQ